MERRCRLCMNTFKVTTESNPDWKLMIEIGSNWMENNSGSSVAHFITSEFIRIIGEIAWRNTGPPVSTPLTCKFKSYIWLCISFIIHFLKVRTMEFAWTRRRSLRFRHWKRWLFTLFGLERLSTNGPRRGFVCNFQAWALHLCWMGLWRITQVMHKTFDFHYHPNKSWKKTMCRLTILKCWLSIKETINS